MLLPRSFRHQGYRKHVMRLFYNSLCNFARNSQCLFVRALDREDSLELEMDEDQILQHQEHMELCLMIKMIAMMVNCLR